MTEEEDEHMTYEQLEKTIKMLFKKRKEDRGQISELTSKNKKLAKKLNSSKK